MTDAFDWNEIADDIVVPEQAAVAVYTNPKGDVVIRQAGQYGPDEDHWIVVAPMHAHALAMAILRESGLRDAEPEMEATSEFPKFDTTTGKDRTAAERMRRYRENKRNARNDRNGGTVTVPFLPSLEEHAG
jgi:hypothetical protein